jgi:hypothetical protein
MKLNKFDTDFAICAVVGVAALLVLLSYIFAILFAVLRSFFPV